MTIVIAKLTDSVFKDGNTILNLGLTIPEGVVDLYWFGTTGWIYSDIRTDITELPQWANDCMAKYEEALPIPPVPPTPTEVCYNTACTLLSETDWTQIPNSGLLNVDEFSTYRQAVRVLALNPVESPVFPIKPTEKW